MPGTHGEATTHAAARNSFSLISLPTNNSDSLPFELSAMVAAIAAEGGERNPARPFQGKRIKGFLGGAKENRFIATERNLLLRAGLSTHYYDGQGNAYVEWLVTGYTENSEGFADDSYRSVNTLFILQRIRWEQRKHFSQNFQGYNLAADGGKTPANELIMTPSLFKSELLSLYRNFVDRGWVQDYEGYKETLVTELDPDNQDRINFVDQPVLVRGWRITAGQSQFK